MNKFIFTALLLLCCAILTSQNKTPAMFRWQDKYAKKNIRKHVKYDTLIRTSEATLHINYNNNPSKPYLLMLHGMGANARTNWSSQIKTLSKEFNLILPDLIYFGESTSESGNLSVEFQAEQIHEAILKLGITSKINIMGFSYGGLTTAVYNELFQNEVNKIIIIDGPVKYFSGRMADSLAKAVGVKSINNVIVPTTVEELDGMIKAVISKSFPASKNIKRKMIKYLFEPTKEVRDKQMNYLMENQVRYQNYNYNLDKTQTLLIWGGKDGVIPPTVGISLNKAFPNTTKLIIYPNAKHDSHFSESKKLNKAVIHFLK